MNDVFFLNAHQNVWKWKMSTKQCMHLNPIETYSPGLSDFVMRRCVWLLQYYQWLCEVTLKMHAVSTTNSVTVKTDLCID